MLGTRDKNGVCLLCQGTGVCPDCDGPCDFCGEDARCGHNVKRIFSRAIVLVAGGTGLLFMHQFVAAALLFGLASLFALAADRIVYIVHKRKEKP